MFLMLIQVRLSMNPLADYSLTSGSRQSQTTCVCGQDTATRTFTIVFSAIGDIDVSVTVSYHWTSYLIEPSVPDTKYCWFLFESEIAVAV